MGVRIIGYRGFDRNDKMKIDWSKLWLVIKIKILCGMGLHDFRYRPLLANLDSYWLQSGKQCIRCHHRVISF